MTKCLKSQALGVDESAESIAGRPKRKVLRHSPDRLLRRKVVLPGGITISAEKHKGRVMVRVEVPEKGR